MSKTSEYLHSSTAQEVFDRIASHLRKQRVPSKDGGFPRYRYNGLMCAAGCIINNEDYDESMENDTWGTVASRLGCYEHTGLITKLQGLHDGWRLSTLSPMLRDPSEFMECMENGLKLIAKIFGLTYSPVDNSIL
jgi:hypothetical protein